jgi:hypothetical protein
MLCYAPLWYGGTVLRNPRALVHHEGTLYVADAGTGKIEAFDAATGQHQRTVVNVAKLKSQRVVPNPHSIALLDGFAFVACSDFSVRRLRLSDGEEVPPPAADAPQISWRVGRRTVRSRDLAVMDGRVWIAEGDSMSDPHRILCFTAGGEFICGVGGPRLRTFLIHTFVTSDGATRPGASRGHLASRRTAAGCTSLVTTGGCRS